MGGHEPICPHPTHSQVVGIATVRWIRFNLVGVMGFVLQTTMIVALVRWAGFATSAAVTVAVLAAVSHNFFWHERFTWPNLPRETRFKRWVSFHVSTGLVSVLSNVVLTLALMKMTRLPVVASNAAAVAIVSLANFWVSDRLVFNAQCPGLNAQRSKPSDQSPTPDMARKLLGIEH